MRQGVRPSCVVSDSRFRLLVRCGSHPGIVSQAHYDQTENIFVQLAGRKRIILAPPAAWRSLRLFPALHASYRYGHTHGQACRRLPLVLLSTHERAHGGTDRARFQHSHRTR